MEKSTGVIANSTIEAVNVLAEHMLKQGYILEKLYEYTNAYWRIRLTHPHKGKWIRPMHKNDEHYYLSEPEFKNNLKPLYELQLILNRPSAQIWIVEGEKCVDSLNNFFTKQNCLSNYIAITSGGATSANSADWSSIKNRSIVIFPDNDEGGNKYANSVAQILTAQDCDVSLIDVRALALLEKGDIVDWLEMNREATLDELLSLPKILYKALAENDENDYNYNYNYNYKNKHKHSNNKEAEVQTIKRLSALSSLEYDRVRLKEAANLGVRVTALDKEVIAIRKILTSTDNDYSILSPMKDPEPWECGVSASELLDELESIIRRYSVIPEYAYTVIPLWICFTWCIDAAHTAPILAISSPEKRCGKTTILSILQMLTKRPLSTSNITPAALFRMIEAYSPTLLIDEGDTFLDKSDELRGVLNSGHTRYSAYVIRTVGDDHNPQQFNTFGAKVIAMIGNLPDTLEDRSIIIRMRRKLQSETVQRLHHSNMKEFAILQRKLLRFANNHVEELKQIRPEALPIKSDRTLDNLELLLAIATLAGSDWLDKAKKAFLSIDGEIVDETSIGTSLLRDIKEIFSTKYMNKIFSKDLLSFLLLDEEKPWVTYNSGKPITQKQMATLLIGFNIRSKALRIEYDNLKGYEMTQFEEAFERYLPSATNSTIVNSSIAGPEIETSQVISPNAPEIAKDIDNNYLLEERAAIMEYDGGMPREMAEKISMKETIIH
jgi:hypothetical protein